MSSSDQLTPTILIVDDRPANLLALQATLSDINATIIKAESGAQALSCLLEHNIALVLLDVQMPEMDGYEVANIMSETPTTANIPIVFLTAIDHDDFHIEKAYLSGAIDFITKPINTTILLAKVSIFLNMWLQNKQLKDLAKNYQAALEEITRHRDQLKELSVKDHLTGLFQRRVFDDMLIKEISRSMRQQQPLSIAMLDLDNFKNINDQYGHAVGDDVLIKIGQIFMSLMREADLVCRYGGEELVILMPNTRLSDAQLISERIRLAVKSTLFDADQGNINLTISIGVSELQLSQKESPEQLLKNADDALYRAKESGRNQIFPALEISR